METTKDRKITAFRLRTSLLERLKLDAKRQNRSLNNYVETLLMDATYRKPNAETMAAIEEARSGKELETLDVDNFKDFVASLRPYEDLEKYTGDGNFQQPANELPNLRVKKSRRI